MEKSQKLKKKCPICGKSFCPPSCAPHKKYCSYSCASRSSRERAIARGREERARIAAARKPFADGCPYKNGQLLDNGSGTVGHSALFNPFQG